MTNFWQYIDKEKAFEYFEKFWKTGRDSLSDCRACDRTYRDRYMPNNAVQHLNS